jgi:hypothetical protein
METIIIVGGPDIKPDPIEDSTADSHDYDHEWQSMPDPPDRPPVASSDVTFTVSPEDQMSITFNSFIQTKHLGAPSAGCFRPHDYIIVADRKKRFRKDRFYFELGGRRLLPHETWEEQPGVPGIPKTVYIIFEDDAATFQVDYAENWADLAVQSTHAGHERDRMRTVMAPLVVCKSDTFGGTGLFARVDLSPNQLHVHYWGAFHPARSVLAGANSKFLMEDVRGDFFDGAAIDHGYAKYINHSPTPNMIRVVADYPYLVFTNNKPVRAGDELFSDYGPHYSYQAHHFVRGAPPRTLPAAFSAPAPVARNEHLVGIDSDWLALHDTHGHLFYQHAATTDVRVTLPARVDDFSGNQALLSERILTADDVRRLYDNLADPMFVLHHLDASRVPALWTVPQTFTRFLDILKHDRGPFSVNLGQNKFAPQHIASLEQTITSSNVCFYFFSPNDHNFSNVFWSATVKRNQERLVDAYRRKGWRVPWFMYCFEDTSISTYSQDLPTVNHWIQTGVNDRALWADFAKHPWNTAFTRLQLFRD